MVIGYSKKFRKQYKKLPKHIQEKFSDNLTIFIKDRHNERLRTHKLHGKLKGFYSINIASDIRAVFEEITLDTFEFIAIGSHSKLYS